MNFNLKLNVYFIRYALISSFIMLILSFVGCHPNGLIKQIYSSQNTYIKKEIPKNIREGYSPILKNLDEILAQISFELSKENIRLLELSNFNILNAYNFGSSLFYGAVWNDTFFYLIEYDYTSEKTLLKKKKIDFSDYEIDSNIDLQIINFLNTQFDKNDLANFPIISRSGSRYYTFSKVKKVDDTYSIKSLAFDEIHPLINLNH